MRLLFLIFLTLPGLAFAGEGMLGTRTESMPTVTQAGGIWPLVQMLFAVGIVGIMVKVMMPRLMTKFGGRLQAKFDGEIKLQESATFAGGSLQVVQVRGRTLLLGVTGSSVNCLADLTGAQVPPAPPTFREMLTEAEPFVPEPVATREEEPPHLTEALERLNRLTR